MESGRLQDIQAKLLDCFIYGNLLIAWDTLLIARYIHINRINLNNFEVLGKSIEEFF